MKEKCEWVFFFWTQCIERERERERTEWWCDHWRTFKVLTMLLHFLYPVKSQQTAWPFITKHWRPTSISTGSGFSISNTNTAGISPIQSTGIGLSLASACWYSQARQQLSHHLLNSLAQRDQTVNEKPWLWCYYKHVYVFWAWLDVAVAVVVCFEAISSSQQDGYKHWVLQPVKWLAGKIILLSWSVMCQVRCELLQLLQILLLICSLLVIECVSSLHLIFCTLNCVICMHSAKKEQSRLLTSWNRT